MAVRAFHPGRILADLYMEPLGLSAGKLAKSLKLDRQRMERLVKQECGVTADTALRLAKALQTTPEYWMNLQANFDLQEARASKELMAQLEEIGAYVEISSVAAAE